MHRNFDLSKNKKDTTMLYTNLKHLENAAEYAQAIGETEHVVVVCGRMGPSCIPVYRAVEELEKEYRHVKFFDMEFDNPESQVIRSLPEVSQFTGVPFVVYYKNGEVVRATSGVQSKQQLIQALTEEFAVAEKV
jgi:thioredoxin 1